MANGYKTQFTSLEELLESQGYDSSMLQDPGALYGFGKGTDYGKFFRPFDTKGYNQAQSSLKNLEEALLTNVGQVGIGTTSPSSKLHIDDSTNYNMEIRRTSSNGIKLEAGSGSPLTSKIKVAYNDFSYIDAITIVNQTAGAYTQGNVGIGTTSPSAPLEVSSTEGGVIMPRMTTAQRNAIVSPTDGEIIYNTSTNKFQGRADGSWEDLH